MGAIKYAILVRQLLVDTQLKLMMLNCIKMQ